MTTRKRSKAAPKPGKGPRIASAPVPPAFAVGDRVMVRPTAEHPIAKRGRVTAVTDDTVSVTVDGFTARYRDHQLIPQR